MHKLLLLVTLLALTCYMLVAAQRVRPREFWERCPPANPKLICPNHHYFYCCQTGCCFMP